MRTRVKRRIRRAVAPRVRRCPCAGARDGAKERMAETGALMIGGAKDPAETRAEARAARALSAAPVIHRKCAACETEEQEARRSPSAGVVAPGKAAAPASRTAETAVKSLGAGRPLSAPERAFYEPRLGADLSPVRLHETATADTAAREMDASAFTLGRDIAFAAGARRRGGPGLLAHELAHAAEDAPQVHRRLWVRANQLPIPGSGPGGASQTIGEATQGYFDRICPAAHSQIEPRGRVRLDPDFCGGSAPVTQGCGCMCELVNSRNDWRIIMRDWPRSGGYPHSRYDDPELAGRPRSGGTGGLIYTPSPNSEREYGAARLNGEIVAMENWETLLHEMCGHARLSTAGRHPREQAGRVRHGHGDVVPMANAARTEILGPDAPARGYLIQHPFCGESYYRRRGTTDWEGGRHLQECRDARAEYLQQMRDQHPDREEFQREYGVEETMPLPPDQQSVETAE